MVGVVDAVLVVDVVEVFVVEAEAEVEEVLKTPGPAEGIFMEEYRSGAAV